MALLVSNFGDWLAMLGLFSYVAFKLNGTPYQVSGIMISFIIPMTIIGPLAGVFVDRWNIKRTMISSDLLRAVITGLLVISTGLPQLYALVFLLSVFSSFFQPSQSVAIQTVVPKEQLLVATAINTQTIQFNRIISPAVAGLLVGWFGEKACFLIDSVTFLVSASLLSMLVVRRDKSESHGGISAVYKQMGEGLAFIRRHKEILFLIVSMVAAIFAVGAYDALIIVYIRDVLHSKANLFGAMMSMVGAGTIVGSLVIAKKGQHLTRVYLIAFGISGLGLSVVLIALSASAALTVPISLMFGLAVAYVLVPAQSLMQEETPRPLLGRVSSTSMSLMTAAQLISFLFAGALASAIGIRNLYYAVGLVLIGIGIVGYTYARVNRIAERPAPATETGIEPEFSSSDAANQVETPAV